MPFKSKAQSKYFHYLESKGKMPKKTVHEFDEATDFHDLPEHVKKAHGGRMYSEGGMVDHMQEGEMRAPHNEEEMPDYDGNGAHYQMGDPMDERNKEELPHFAHGGMVNYDYEMGNASEFDSSGEPHTEDDLEDEHPMEYMAKGGRAKKMARGGMSMPHPQFLKALTKARFK